MATFNVTFSNVLLMLLYMLPGFLLCKFRKVRPDHLSSVSVILLYICGPGMFLNALTALDLPDLQIDLRKFEKATDEEKVQAEVVIHRLHQAASALSL